MILEQEFTCPYCWELISMVLEESEISQEYVEDCEVCCNPILIRCEFAEDQLTAFSAELLEQ